MILFLTYHKVLPGPESKPEFYTVSADQFKRHLELLEESRFQSLTPQELMSLNPSNRSFNEGPTRCLLTFDDGTLDHYETILPLLAPFKHRAIFFVPTVKLNRPGYLTSAMLKEITKAGHWIGLHSHEHRRLDEMSVEDIRVQMEVSQKILAELTGSLPVFFAPPGGYVDRRVRDVALESGVRAIRTMRWGYNRNPNLTALECVPLNRNTTEVQFREILQFRNLAVAYNAKQTIRNLLPTSLYEPLRNSVAHLLRRN